MFDDESSWRALLACHLKYVGVCRRAKVQQTLNLWERIDRYRLHNWALAALIVPLVKRFLILHTAATYTRSLLFETLQFSLREHNDMMAAAQLVRA